MSEKKFHEDSNFWIGVGAYYGLSWVFTFYPAFIFGLAICQQTDPSMEEYAELFGLFWMIVVYIFIQIVIVVRAYKAVIFIYLATLWPFLHQLYWYQYHLNSGPGGTNECFPLPPVDWWLFW